MSNPKEVLWQLRHEDEVWTEEDEFICNCQNPDYPGDSSIARYIVEMHNAQIDKTENSKLDINDWWASEKEVTSP